MSCDQYPVPRRGIEHRIARLAPCFVGQHPVAPQMIVGQPDRIGQTQRHPHRHVPPEGLLDVDVRSRLLARQFGELTHRRILAFTARGQLQGTRQIEIQQCAAAPLVLARQQMIETVAVETGPVQARAAAVSFQALVSFHHVITGATCRSWASINRGMSAGGR